MRRWVPLLAVCLGTFMLLVDVTIVTVALPAISTALDASFSSLQWILDIYALLLAALVMAAGAASDLLGRKRIYLAGLVLFAVSSLACGLSINISMLIAARAVQGVGAAAMFATTTALIAATYTGRERGIAFGLWGAVNGAAAASGPIIGGLLTEHFSWRAIFLINLPVAVIALVVSVLGLSESRNPAATRVDIGGTVVFTTAVAAIVYGMISGNDNGWSDPVTLVSLDIGIVGLVVFVLIEKGKPHAMLDMTLMRTPSFAAMMFAALMLNGCAFANLAFVSVWLQSVQSLDPVQTGLVFMPLSITSFVVAAITGRRMHKFAPKIPVGVGLLLIGIGVLIQTRVSAGSEWTVLLPGLFVTGLGVGMTNPALADAALGAAPRERAGMAGGATNTFRQLGYAIGIAVLGTVFATQAKAQLGMFSSPELAASVLSTGQSPRLVAAVPSDLRLSAEQAIQAAFADGLDRIFLLSGLGALLAGVIALLLVKSNPASATMDSDEQTVVFPSAPPRRGRHRVETIGRENAFFPQQLPVPSPFDVRHPSPDNTPSARPDLAVVGAVQRVGQHASADIG